MHILGKIFTVLSVIMAAVGFYFAGKAVFARQEWTEKVDALQKQNLGYTFYWNVECGTVKKSVDVDENDNADVLIRE